ncbi:MAG: ferritin-like protein [Alphaproteobacteria bacterium]
MSLYQITDIDELRRHLQAAVQLEHATIPPYLTALYSIRPGTNADAYHVLRVVAVEEMLHLTLAANMLNAVGGSPDLTQPGFVPDYPAYLPNGETDFQADLRPFSREAMDTFLKIERPARPPLPEPTPGGGSSAAAASADSTHHRNRGQGRRRAAQTVHRPRRHRSVRAAHVHDGSEEHFYSIGEFYKAIEDGLVLLHEQHGDALFSGDPRLQVTSDYYYSGGGELFPVADLTSAKQAIRLISEQGEGVGGGIFDYEAEISHYYRFEQLIRGRYYRESDMPQHPTGGTVSVDWDAVYPIKANAKLSDYPKGSDVHRAAEVFNNQYSAFLQMLTRAFRGQPELLIEAVGEMFVLKELAYRLTRQPIDGPGTPHAAPTFEMPA